MKKYLIYGLGRTGSTLYSNLLDIYYKTVFLRNNNIFYSRHDLKIDWSYPIQHTHQIDAVSDMPEDFILLLTTRSILDSIISLFVAEKTTTYTITSESEKTHYINENQDLKIHIDIWKFIKNVKLIDNDYSKILQIYEKLALEKYIIEYNECAINKNKFFKNIGIDYKLETKTFEKMPIDKFSMITNLKSVISAYKNIKVKNNFNDEITIDYIQKKLY